MLEPAVVVMNRLRYPEKFILISLLFTIPIAFLMYQWLTQLGSRLDFTARERVGLEYVMALRQVMEPLERTRVLRLLADNGDAPARTQLDEERGKVLRGGGPDGLRQRPRWEAELQVRDVWLELRPRVAHPSVEPGALIVQTRRLLEQVADTSKLSLDSDLDSYQLTTAVVTRLPALADDLTTIGARRGFPTPAGRRERGPGSHAARRPQSGEGRARRARSGTRGGLPGQPGGAPRSGERAPRIVGRRRRSRRPHDRPGRGPGRSGRLGAGAVYERYARAVGAVFRHDAAASSTLDTLLQARMRGLVITRRLLLSFVVVTLSLVAYLWIGFYVAVRRAVRALDRTSQRMLTGDFPGDVVVESRDELRDVVQSFNTVADRLRTEWQRAQDESARARAAEASLAKARDVAEAATRAKSEFLAVMSHEIRTPMNGVLGMAHLLLDTTLTPTSTGRWPRYATRAQALLTILNDILDFSKMEAGKLELLDEDFDLPSLIANVTGLLAFRAQEKGLDPRQRHRCRRSRRAARRPRPPPPGPAQSGRQRDQVHRPGSGAGRGDP